MKVVFLDTETTSADDDRRMIQLAYKIIENWKEVKTYNKYFWTDVEISIWAKATHNITEDILKSKWINLEDERDLIQSDLEGAYIIAHNSDFDKKTLELEWFPVNDWKWIDSYVISYNLLTEDMVEAYNLQYLRYYFYPQDIKFSEEITAHDALWDILVLEKVFEQLEKIYLSNTDNEYYLDDMVEDTEKWIILRICKFPKHRWKLWVEVEKEDPGFINWVWNNVKMDKQLQATILNLLYKRK